MSPFSNYIQLYFYLPKEPYLTKLDYFFSSVPWGTGTLRPTPQLVTTE